jgi:hypothetical protein
MRLQLSSPGGASPHLPAARAAALAALAAAAALALTAGDVRAQADDSPAAAVGLRVYADDDHVTVWSPSARAAATLPRAVVVDVHATVDAVTAASIDVTSSASPYSFSERRVEGGAGVAAPVAAYQQVGGTVIVSDEHDYTSLRVGARARAELARRNATLEVAYTAGFDQVGRAGDPTFARDRGEHRGVISLTQIVDRRGYLDVVVEGVRTTGYQSNPYRFVPVTMAGVVAYALPEAVPDVRNAVAASVRVRRAVGATWFGHADYRLARDTWGVTSHTASARLLRGLADDAVLLGAEVRGYLQDGASFHRASYAGEVGAPVWRTRDHVLGAMRTITLGTTARVRLPWRAAEATAALAWMRFGWLDDPRQRRRDAVVSSLTVLVPL